MATIVSNIAKSSMLNAININKISVHDGETGASGVDNEIEVTRQSCSFSTTVNGSRSLTADVVFTIPAGNIVMYIGYWDNDEFLMSECIDSLSYSAQGKLTLLANVTEVTI